MKETKSLRDITILLRKYLIILSELKPDHVKNSLSKYGAAIETENKSILEALKSDEQMLFYELRTRETTSNVSMTISDDVEYYKSFSLHCIIYGDNSQMLAQKIVARFRTAIVKMQLQYEGCYISEVSDPESINEFINSVMRFRSDFDINISIKFRIEQNLTDSEIEAIDLLQIEEL